MASRLKIAAGNWKMNLNLEQALTLVSELSNIVKDEYQGNAKVILAPSFPFLAAVKHLIKDHPRFHLAAQNVHAAASGAYTGEVSVGMLASVGVTHTIVGHSERRQYFGEGGKNLAEKVSACLAGGLTPIYCIGETLEERNAGKAFEVLSSQLETEVFALSAEDFGKIVIAYEPVWAIGTGVTASPEQAQEVHAFVRKAIAEKYTQSLAESISILYGGSVKADNAKELFAMPDIDGGLVGGASLKSREFAEIVKAL